MQAISFVQYEVLPISITSALYNNPTLLSLNKSLAKLQPFARFPFVFVFSLLYFCNFTITLKNKKEN